MKIVVAVDGSAYTRKALDYLVAHRAQLVEGNELVLVNVCSSIPPHASRHISKELLNEYYTDESAKVLDPVKAQLAELGVSNYSIQARHGNAAGEIVAAAKEVDASLIVVGTRGHGTLGRALMGSVATNVIADAERSVLLVQ
ncbi:MAG: universal stress protein [Comamonadaceae bacterium]|nr:MAG: universal stress protein [Comamonadaceae bacterium]